MLHNSISRRIKAQSGFTLIEMIVVVGIIAVLAAVIVPNVSKFINNGEQGAKDVEMDHVEDAFELMMAENQLAAVVPHDKSNSSTATNSWNVLPQTGLGSIPLQGYLLDTSTVYYYCYDADGNVREQFEVSTICSLP